MMNLPRRLDSYKNEHYKVFPPNTTYMQYHLIARGGKFDRAPFFGLQYYLSHYLSKPITEAEVNFARQRAIKHFGDDTHFNYEGFMHIVQDHDGYLPLLINTVPEGTIVNTPNTFMTVENTCPKCAWVPGAFETLLEKLWYPITVGAVSMAAKKMIKEARVKAGTLEDNPFGIHDFGYRGASSEESAEIGGAAHLIFFLGTDTQIATDFLTDYYSEDMAGHSVTASEHSGAGLWGPDNEIGYLDRMLEIRPSGIVSIVVDTYDAINFLKNVVSRRKEQILARDGKVVFRLDSGNADKQMPEAFDILSKIFGESTNNAGYRLLNPKVGLLWGDGNNLKTLPTLLRSLLDHKIVPDFPLGMGGALLQKVNRDDMKFAYKANWACVNDKDVNVYKETATDPSKASWKHGRLALETNYDNTFTMVPESTVKNNALVPVFKNGKILHETTFKEIRERAKL